MNDEKRKTIYRNAVDEIKISCKISSEVFSERMRRFLCLELFCSICHSGFAIIDP